MSFINKHIFFLIVAASLSLVTVQQAYATHYTELGMDDVFYWREYNAGGLTDDIDCQFNGGTFLQDDGADNIQFIAADNGITERGLCLIIKTFNIIDIENVGGSNTFSLTTEHSCDVAACFYLAMAVLDGNYQQYYNHSDPDIFKDTQTLTSVLDVNKLDPGSWGDLEQASIGLKTNLDCINSSTKGTVTISCTIDTTEWGRALTDYVSVIILWGRGSSDPPTNHTFMPESFSITNTPNGTLTWNWPETGPELANWNTYGYKLLELNGTVHDYGYFITYDEGIPDPPINLIAVTGTSSIELDWDAPIFNGYDPIIGYKIERESPIGGGFSTIVPNTGSVVTGYTDTSVIIGNEYNYRVRAINSHGESAPSNESKDGIGSSITDATPDVDCTGLNLTDFTLYDRGITTDTVTICWNGEIITPVANILGYQINFTTPWGDPLTIVTGLNNTGDNATTRLIENLSPATQYSFRVQSWMNGSANNVTQILNVTTLPPGFDLEDFNFGGETNPFRWDWGFTEVDLGGNYTSLLVDYANTVNATCVFDFRFANTQQTFSNISTVPSDEVGRVVANFTMQNPENEVIHVTCYDENNLDSEGRTVVSRQSFPLLEQIQGFRAGDYGTTGDFGVFDLVTFVVVIISMIGFNRVNSAVGAFFSFVIIAVAAYFEIIAPMSAFLMGAVVLAVGVGLFMHHRNDING